MASVYCSFFCQAEDGIRDLVRSRGLGDVYKRQVDAHAHFEDGLACRNGLLLVLMHEGRHGQTASS